MDKTTYPYLFFFQKDRKFQRNSKTKFPNQKTRKNKNNEIRKTDATSSSTKIPNLTQQNTPTRNQIPYHRPKRTPFHTNHIHAILDIHKRNPVLTIPGNRSQRHPETIE